MKIIKNCGFHWFLTKILINSLALGGSPTPEPHANAYFYKFLNFCPNFREKFDNIWKIMKKGKFSAKLSKNLKFSLVFSKIFENFLGVPGALPPDLHDATPSQTLPGWPRFSPPEKIPAGANDFLNFLRKNNKTEDGNLRKNCHFSGHI